MRQLRRTGLRPYKTKSLLGRVVLEYQLKSFEHTNNNCPPLAVARARVHMIAINNKTTIRTHQRSLHARRAFVWMG